MDEAIATAAICQTKVGRADGVPESRLVLPSERLFDQAPKSLARTNAANSSIGLLERSELRQGQSLHRGIRHTALRQALRRVCEEIQGRLILKTYLQELVASTAHPRAESLPCLAKARGEEIPIQDQRLARSVIQRLPRQLLQTSGRAEVVVPQLRQSVLRAWSQARGAQDPGGVA